MEKRKLSDLRITSIGKEYAIILNSHYIEDENYTNWDSNDFMAFIDKHYDDFVLTAIDEGIILPSETKHFKTLIGDNHDRIKGVTIDKLRLLIKER
jgi:hypothetical protein